MSRFERNDISLIRKTINEEIEGVKIGQVSRVHEHGAPDDDANYEINVEIDASTAEERRCPFISSGTGQVSVPKVGDKVLVIYGEGRVQKPFVTDILWTNEDRPPSGRAGMYRDRFESGDSPAGSGDLYLTGYTEYDDSPAIKSKYDLTPERTLIQIAKHPEGDNVNPANQDAVPAKVEFYDAPADDQAHVTIQLDNVDGASADASWGINFDLKTGEIKLVDPSGHGIESDGSGNFTWHHQTLDLNEVSGSTGPLSL